MNPGNSIEIYMQDPDSNGLLPVGAYVQSASVGTAGTITNGVLGSVQITKAGTSNYVISADFSPIGASTRTVQVYNGTNLVAQVSGQSGPVATTASFELGISLECFPCRRVKDIILGATASVALHGGPTVVGNKLVITPEGGIAAESESLGRITAAQIPSLTIIREDVAVTYEGLTHTAAGDATLSVTSNRLTVANIGSSGQDGVEEPGKQH